MQAVASWVSGEVERHFVDKAPAPVFAALDGLHNGMLSGVEVLGGVFVLGGVAATDVAALEAEAEVDPGVAGLEALLAAFGVGVNVADLVEVGARRHGGSW